MARSLDKTAGSSDAACAPHHTAPPIDHDDSVDWRNDDVKLKIDQDRLDGIRYVSFHEATRNLHSLHPGNGDCTHFCWTPALWQPLWAALIKEVQRDGYVKPSIGLGPALKTNMGDRSGGYDLSLIPIMSDEMRNKSSNVSIGNPYEWIPMTDPRDWYRTAELCMYTRWTADMTFPAALSMCGFDEREQSGPDATNMLGSSLKPNIDCSVPLSATPHLMKTMAGFSRYDDKSLVEALLVLHLSNRTVVFIGDSLTEQSVGAFFAELKRLDSDIEVKVWTDRVSSKHPDAACFALNGCYFAI
jgi:hypothetical protein